MSDQLFDVVFFGILQTGKNKEAAMQNMASLFKTDAEKLASYFAGGRKVIKAKVNASAAKKYKAALENIGLVITIEACDTGQENVPTDTGNLSIAAVGADVIEHPTEKPVQKIDDISSITMAEPGADVIENPVEIPAQKIDDISDITMAEVGSDVLEEPQEVVAQKIDDLSDLSLAEAGVDLIENPKAKEKAKIPDTSELSLDE